MAGFDTTAFMNAEVSRRTDTVTLATLAVFFPEGENPIFTVQNLTAPEIAQVREAVAKNAAARRALLKAEKEGATEEILAAIRTLLAATGGKGVPDEYARYLKLVTLGCVDPAIDHETAKRLAKAAPVGFESLAVKILTLTGLGGDVKKK